MTDNIPEKLPVPNQAEKERQITWRVVDEKKFRFLLAETIEETAYQQASAADGFIDLLASQDPRYESRQASNAINAKKATDQLIKQLRSIQHLLRRNPNQPIPIEAKYTNKEIIALDLVTNQENDR